MEHFWRALRTDGDTVGTVLQAVVTLALGLLLARLASAGLRRLLAARGTPQQTLIARRTAFYGILGIATVTALNQLGFDLSVLLGAAGILTVAIGFASQTSASNLISGLFLIGERPFVVGDVIRVGGTTGEVITLDLLSVKLRTPDNLLVRIPNETMLRSEITNFTRYPIRRLDLRLRVAYGSDLGRVRALLHEVAEGQPLCLDEPRPTVAILAFGESGLELELWVWARRENFLEVGNTLREAIDAAFGREGIAMALPQRVMQVVTAAEDELPA
jgi:small-conductance mechanosensitive channel